MNSKYISLVILVFIVIGCSSAKKQAELLEQTKPAWLKERPVNPMYYYGIGITPKIGAPMLYEDKAKERALADISSQINSTIKSEAFYLQVEDKQGVHDYLQNRIRSVSSEYLEGYEYVDKWEDLSNVYAYYRLNKQKYQEIKAERKRKAILTASEKFIAAERLINEGAHVSAIEHYAWSIDVLSGYVNETVMTEIDGRSIDLLSESINGIKSIIHNLKVDFDSGLGFKLIDASGRVVTNMPLKLKYSAGYLTNDLMKTDSNGFVDWPVLPNSEKESSKILTAEVDLVNLARQVSKNLYVRKIIEQQKAPNVVVEI